jgi:hypothetical protein
VISNDIKEIQDEEYRLLIEDNNNWIKELNEGKMKLEKGLPSSITKH